AAVPASLNFTHGKIFDRALHKFLAGISHFSAVGKNSKLRMKIRIPENLIDDRFPIGKRRIHFVSQVSDVTLWIDFVTERLFRFKVIWVCHDEFYYKSRIAEAASATMRMTK